MEGWRPMREKMTYFKCCEFGQPCPKSFVIAFDTPPGTYINGGNWIGIGIGIGILFI